MYRKIMEKVANAGTLALLGYEFGSHMNNEQENTTDNIGEKKNHDVEIIVFILIILLFIVIAYLI